MVAKIKTDQSAAPTSADEEREKLHAQFRAAVSGGRIEEATRILQSHRDLANAPIFAFGGRPIANANGNAAMVDLLIEHGADINLKSDWWAGPWGLLEMAYGETAEMLIERGAIVDVFAAAHLNKLDRLRELLEADPSLVHARGGDGCRPLHFARSAEAMDLLLSLGADIDARDVDHESTAAQWRMLRPPARDDDEPHGGLRTMRMFVDRGAGTDVFMAAALGDARMLKTLLDENPSVINQRVGSVDYPPCPVAPGKHIYVYALVEGTTLLQVTAQFGSEACMNLLMARSTPRQKFLGACSIGNEIVAREALAVEPGLMKSLTPAEHGYLAAAAWAGKTSAVKLMLDMGFDPAAPGADSGTPLHCAAWQGRAEIVRTILSHDSVRPRLRELVNATEPTHKSTPLGWCCHGSTNRRNPAGDYPAVAKLLLDAGATVAKNFADASEAVKEVIQRFGGPKTG
jgi:ankyrin repeat protein